MANPNDYPITRAEAERLGPRDGLLRLYDISDAHIGDARRSRESRIAELALSSAVITWWTHLQPEIIHRALVDGADLQQVSGALGVDELRAYDTWTRWANEQATSPTAQESDLSAIETIRNQFGYGGLSDSP